MAQADPQGRSLTAPQLDAELDLSRGPVPVDLHHDEQRQQVELALAKIPDVIAARLVPGYDRPVDELHIVTTPARGAKATVRDAQTVLLARFGVDIDHRVVSVVQLNEEQVASNARRITVAEVGVVSAGLDLVASVRLRLDDDEAHGSTKATATNGGQYRAVASATLAAIRELHPEELAVELLGAELVAVGGSQVALTVLELRDQRRADLRCGTAIVRESSAEAISRSVLDALNRTLELS